MNRLHPALAFLRDKMPKAQALGSDALRLDLDGKRVEIFVVPENAPRVFFAAGRTRLAYRSGAELSDDAKQRLRAALLELRELLATGHVVDPGVPLPEGGGWTDRLHNGDLIAWRQWVARSYRATVEAGRRDECHGLPDCIDMRMRPPIQARWMELREAPRGGACSRCGRARGCFAARDIETDRLKPLRHTDAFSAEIAALETLAEASSVPVADALEAYSLLTAACGDRALEGALPLEYSVRLPLGEQQPDRLRFVNYYPLVTNDEVRREINRLRRAAVKELASRWLTAQEMASVAIWLECVESGQPDTLGLSIGIELERKGIRLQVYAHPESSRDTERFVENVVRKLGGCAERIPAPAVSPVLVGLALTADRPPALKLYYHRAWTERADTGLLPDGLGDLTPFNPGWGLAIQQHVQGRAAWAKWDFPVTTHFQDYDRFLFAFSSMTGLRGERVPRWLSGETFTPWPTWASLGRGSWALYFHAR